MVELKDKILKLKKQKNAIILAHYYVDEQIQALADFVGDSYYLSKIAKEREEKIIIFCGVTFMGESSKILSPEKIVVVPENDAICPMAEMVNVNDIKKVREKYEDLAVVCYVNSSAEVKAYSDVCVTSSNALKIVKSLKEKNIFFIPDRNLGKYLSSKIPEKNFILHSGFCCVHENMDKESVENTKKSHPQAEVLAHPECTCDVLELADFIGSTSQIIDYATKSNNKEFIICTEKGVMYELKNKNPEKIFYEVTKDQYCNNMRKVSLEKIYKALDTLKPQITVEENIRVNAAKALEAMLQLAK